MLRTKRRNLPTLKLESTCVIHWFSLLATHVADQNLKLSEYGDALKYIGEELMSLCTPLFIPVDALAKRHQQ